MLNNYTATTLQVNSSVGKMAMCLDRTLSGMPPVEDSATMAKLYEERKKGESETVNVTIRVKNSIMFAHSVVLMTKSSYLRTLILNSKNENEDLEKMRHTITLDQISADVMEILLFYLYTGEFSSDLLRVNNNTLLADVQSNANMMNLAPLREYCEQIRTG